MKRLLLSLLPALLLVLLSSCSRGSESIGLWSEEGVVVYSSRDDGAMVTIDKALLQEMTGEGDLEELVSSLFPRVKLYRVEVSQWRQREAVVSSFVAFTETESLTEAYGKEKKSISSSGFFSSMKTISEGFDEALFRMVKKYGSSFQEYRAETAVGEEEDGEGKALFLKKWIKAIV